MHKPSTIHVLGDLNLDIVLSGLEDFPSLGKERLAGGCVMKPGGSAANVAIMLSINACPVRLFAHIGNDQAGEFLLQSMKTYGIDTETISSSAQVKTGLTVSLSFPEDRMYISYAGSVAASSLKQMVNRYIDQHAHLHLTSYFLQTSLKNNVEEVLRKAKASGMGTSLDPGSDTSGSWDISELKRCLKYIDYFMPSSDEICAMTGREDVVAALRVFPKEARAIIVKAGAKGAFIRYNGETETHTALPVNLVDSTCAGDCFDAGFLYGLYAGDTMQVAVEKGLQFGAQAVSTLGLPSEKIDHFLKEQL